MFLKQSVLDSDSVQKTDIYEVYILDEHSSSPVKLTAASRLDANDNVY